MKSNPRLKGLETAADHDDLNKNMQDEREGEWIMYVLQVSFPHEICSRHGRRVWRIITFRNLDLNLCILKDHVAQEIQSTNQKEATNYGTTKQIGVGVEVKVVNAADVTTP